MKIWIVCHRRFDHGQAGLYAFSSSDKAYLHAARLIVDELPTLIGMDAEAGPELATALAEQRHEDAVQLYHEVEGNLDAIDVACQEVDQFHKDEPLEVPALG
jgi:hypothetical protein